MAKKDHPASLQNIIANSIEELLDHNQKAYEILMGLIDTGFFETRQTNKPLIDVADELLDTLKLEENED